MQSDFEIGDDDLDYGDEYVDLEDMQHELVYKPGGLSGLQFITSANSQIPS